MAAPGRTGMDAGEVLSYFCPNTSCIHLPTIRANTANGYINIIENHIIPALGKKTLEKLHRTDIQNFYNSLTKEKGLSITTLYYVHRVLRKALKEAVLNDLVLKNPCDSVTLPKKKKYKATVLDVQQIRCLLSALLGSNCELEVLIAVTMGLRRGEVLGLRLHDFNFEKKTVQICQQITTVYDRKYLKEHPEADTWGITEVKTEKGNREVYVPQAVLDAVEERINVIKHNRATYGSAYQNHDLLCCHPDGRILSPQTVYHRFKKILKSANLPDIRFHDLRHSCASALLDMDVPLKVISEMLGHASIKVTADLYIDVIEKKKQPADVMQNAFFLKNVEEVSVNEKCEAVS
jgi:integrase